MINFFITLYHCLWFHIQLSLKIYKVVSILGYHIAKMFLFLNHHNNTYPELLLDEGVLNTINESKKAI